LNPKTSLSEETLQPLQRIVEVFEKNQRLLFCNCNSRTKVLLQRASLLNAAKTAPYLREIGAAARAPRSSYGPPIHKVPRFPPFARM
jgi:hypothetical protein